MSIRSELPVIDRSVSLAYIAEFSERVSTLTEELRDQILAPRPRKNAPTFTTSEVAELCGLDRSKIHYLASREGTTLPTGAAYGTGRVDFSPSRKHAPTSSKFPKSTSLHW